MRDRETQRKIDAARRGASELENHLVDEYVAGRVGRREFLRRGAMLGISTSALGVLVSACGGANSSPKDAGSPATSSGKARRGGTLRVGVQAPNGPVEPHIANGIGAVAVSSITGEYLTRARPDLSLAPELATEWKPDASASAWTFTLREGVTFHSGAPMTADDVIATFDRLCDPKGGSTALSALKGVLSPGNIEKRDAHTAVFHLDAPNANFPGLVCSQIYQCVVLPKDYDGKFEQDFNTTGPFVVKDYKRNVSGTFVRNPDYWRPGRPYIDGVSLHFYQDEQAQVLALQGNQLDLVTQVSFQGARPLEGNANLQIFASKSAAHREAHMRVDKAPWDDKRVRRALALSLDREAIVKGLFDGRADIGSDSPFWSGYPSSDPGAPKRSQDVEEAKALLAEAGQESGFSATLTTLRYAEVPDYAVLIQSAAKKIGINLDVKVLTSAQYYGSGDDQPWLVVPFGITDFGHRPTPNLYLSSCLGTGGVWNSSHFSNSEYDQLLKQWTGEVDVQRQREHAGKLAALLQDETPAVFSYFYNALAAGTKQVSGYEVDANAVLGLADTWLAA